MDKNRMFSERLIKAVEQSNKSINCIERELGYSRNALHNYKSGAEPSGSRLVELSQYFQLAPEYLIGKSDETFSICPEIVFNRMDEEQKIELLMLSLKWMQTIIGQPQNR